MAEHFAGTARCGGPKEDCAWVCGNLVICTLTLTHSFSECSRVLRVTFPKTPFFRFIVVIVSCSLHLFVSSAQLRLLYFHGSILGFSDHYIFCSVFLL